ncbi:peptidoglycan-binding protein [Streptomyces sp. NBC_00237]|uniref:peptidoglycan-binding domain-containing protein n=1 Tax=Streptomyces sp. NBC_00237 TaxID=2975687 RepID=UPI0022554B13|nr:peptidoglycan-binding protein [Streptomyces sp. NBC_00237]MCX5201462.1 peptidoglycan-binding protein [Streptomyces sp. NBC_00237]
MPLRPIPPTAPGPEAEPPAKPRRKGLALLTAAATLAVLAGTTFALGAFDSPPEPARALPGPRVTTAPTQVTEETPSPAPSRSATASATRTRDALPTPTRASRSATTPKKPTASATKKPQPPPPATTKAPEPTDPPKDELPPGTLAEGSTGPDVTELQERLHQVALYNGPRDGRYTARVTESVVSFQSYMGIDDEPKGVYGPETREALEGWTNEP